MDEPLKGDEEIYAKLLQPKICISLSINLEGIGDTSKLVKLVSEVSRAAREAGLSISSLDVKYSYVLEEDGSTPSCPARPQTYYGAYGDESL
ncbi:MAG: hypothetical protein F7B17_01750 [Desulfurococcales archaeon]|nr:hypothetical protein [Desulfurococcales archaeon]